MKKSAAAALVLMVLLFGGAYLTATEPDEPAPETPQAQEDGEVVLTIKTGEAAERMTLRDYLVGVVRGEMPASFEMEALKAQAAAERTYVYYQLAQGRKDAHPDADFCTDHTCCSAYLSETAAKEKWAADFAPWNTRVVQAVADTDGLVALYDGEPILAVFHSSSAGSTAASGDVWTAELPYLVSVKSPEEADSVPNYYSVNTFTAEEFRTIFCKAHADARLSGDCSGWVKDILLTNAGRVASATVGGVSVTGKELRSLFGLRSAVFTVETAGDTITFHVTGYGHGVGMSQYGANELAKEGKNWQEILQWYYTGVTIGLYNG